MGETFGERLKRLREARGWPQARLAEKLGVDESAVREWETGGATPGIEQLKRLGETFETTVDSLIGADAQVCHAIDYAKLPAKKTNRRAAIAGVVASCVAFVLYLACALTAVFILPDAIPVWGKALALVLPGLAAIALVFQAARRIKEIKGGEEDDSGKY